MGEPEVILPKIVSRDEWLEARIVLKAEEEDFAKKRGSLTTKRRKLPMVEMSKEYVFESPEGKVGLIDLFDGRRQLLVYHFWFEPGGDPCEGCSAWTRDLGDLGGNFASLTKYDTALAYVSRAPADQIAGVKERRSWTMPWYSLAGEGFLDATGYDGWAQISVFVRDCDKAYLANVVPFADLINIGNHWTLLETTPLGIPED